MRKILIVGGGQSGLHLAHGLLTRGYDVTIMSAQSSGEVRRASPSTTQFSLPLALSSERELGLDLWSAQAPRISGARLELHPPYMPPAVLSGSFAAHGNGFGVAVDRRVKMADWLEFFEDQGGKVVIHGATLTDVDYFSRMYDLTIVAVGGGELGAVFDVDQSRLGGGHQRVITQVLVDRVEPALTDYADVVSAAQGRILIAPVLTADGPAYSVCVMGEPGGPLDGSHLRPERGRPHPGQVAEWIVGTLAREFPDVAARIQHGAPLDATAALVSRVRPHVRKPVQRLSGGAVLGMADAVVSTDPIGGQGWNLSSLCAQVYLQRIVEHGDQTFTPDWQQETFEAFWRSGGESAARLSDLLHRMWDPEAAEAMPHLTEVLFAAAQHQSVADRFIGDLADPRRYDTWLYDPESASAFLNEAAPA
ncbi:hypothetical protein LP52_15605 [Streptomonospora alba]|uniref:Styrene monooxygenase StyA putative substrate binding domain-containing protein n=1 Tax=Streptomonospora alba TaxID=183763 RepID=A0A0C2JGT9_9ACTN|nr:styrene monooxygenase/indole monooxygenase family protein [Streptomonospora alba]KIH98110.1 hypothetical protein LP52_15605 [Streptomonospora alba]